MISGETVQAVVLGFRHSSGLKLDAAEDVAGFVEYRVRKVIEEAMKIQQRCPGQQQLSALHIEYAMRRLGMEPLYGFSTGGSGSNKRHGTFSKVTVKQGGRSLILLKEEEIDLEKPNLFPIPDPPPDTTLGVHWLLVRGEVPLVEENEVEFPPQVPLDERVKFPFSRGRVATETETQDNQQQNPEKGASGGAAAASAGADRQVNRDVSRPPLPLPLPAGFDALPGSVHGRSSVVGGLGMATAVAAAAGSSSSSSAAAAAVASPVGSPFARQFTDTHFYAGAADVQRITTTGFSAVGAGFGQTERHADRDRDVANPSSSNLLLTVAGPGATTGPGQVAEQALRDNRTRHLEQLFNVPKLAPELQAVLRAVYKAVQDVRQSEGGGG
uniref:TATA box binding protein associated factor (TAF) histone-like fold domain-containing protein n=1 Tax=Chromera velia CCMP2878 TaxID=1169474 RepID=A0A0G4I630_9ALVE|eukprot:Cvel_11267.t1-p1 / transcript=Cvel_11267.t1 / gene=Cvel_11267 / organism=Chromera_velia_CCMP2878 / gene_product=hypothetical protein / transcript_product=hypothetical protein / location=Cvel_scaffold702:61735-65200(-) / protein_length=383 / sequence_SO=supercontig / SO=protein_coding / is_pseudo=false